MIRVLLVAALVARAPRFLGPPIKADAGVPDAGDAQSGTHSGEADPPLLHPGDDAPMFSGVLHNPEAAGGRQIDLSNMVGSDAEQPAKAAPLVCAVKEVLCVSTATPIALPASPMARA